ncbi:MAG: hypothetical protein D6819_04650, partial [Gammaproteobacteria bacterium]
MNNLIRKAFFWLAFLGLAACSGGGGGGSDITESGFSGPDPIKVTITAQKTTLPANLQHFLPDLGSPFTTEVTVEVQRADGSPIPNGTPVQMQVDNI